MSILLKMMVSVMISVAHGDVSNAKRFLKTLFTEHTVKTHRENRSPPVDPKVSNDSWELFININPFQQKIYVTSSHMYLLQVVPCNILFGIPHLFTKERYFGERSDVPLNNFVICATIGRGRVSDSLLEPWFFAISKTYV